MRKVLITGTAGFIGYHLAELLLAEGWLVHGFDAFTDYYDVTLKQARQARLVRSNAFSSTIGRVEDMDALARAAEAFRPEVIVHLAAQAGVRYSLENPRSYVDTNVTGSFNVLEVARRLDVAHLVFASTSSVYGGNSKMPFEETDKADQPLTIYAATKKAAEALAHSYAHLWGVPMTGLRFFTVYGPWGRPDMALFKFTRAILAGEPIDIYNGGDMYRDFTYIDDLVRAIRLLIDAVPLKGRPVGENDSLSAVAPFRVVNIGNNDKVRLLDFIDALEQAIGIPAQRRYMEMQKGDVFATWADSSLLRSLTGFSPSTGYRAGVGRFVEWYRGYYQR
ncbi:MAG: SDR family NAD(P)-dependent oxidoreductase [Hyphomicrobiales bacterium]